MLLNFIIFLIVLIAIIALYLTPKMLALYKGYYISPPGISLMEADFSNLTGEVLGPYYVHAGGRNVFRISRESYIFDKNGVFIEDYNEVYNDKDKKIGRQINPAYVAHYGLESYNLYLKTGEEECRTQFIRQVDWLVNNQRDGKWEYNFEWKPYLLKYPWISAMSQGQGISALLRAYQLTGEERYLEVASAAMRILETPIEEGGVADSSGNGIWYEEYPNTELIHVMNGHIWALFGIWDYYRVTRIEKALKLFNEGITVLKENIAKYDTGFWVHYDLREDSSPDNFYFMDKFYLSFEIAQLDVLYAITSEKIFSFYADKWRRYQRSLKGLFGIGEAILRQKIRRLKIS